MRPVKRVDRMLGWLRRRKCLERVGRKGEEDGLWTSLSFISRLFNVLEA